MELRQLRTFVAVAEELSFSRAAQRLSIAQPAVSQQIMQLERSIDAQLFDRRANAISLTDAGRSLYADAPRLLAELAEAANRARFASQGQFGQLRVGFSGYYLLAPVPEAISDLKTVIPDLDVTLSHHTYEHLFSALSHRSIDVGVYRRWSAPSPLPSIVIDRPKLTAVLPARHPLLGQPSVELIQLAREQFIFINSPGYAETIQAACRSVGFVPSVARLMMNAAAAIYAVAENTGIAILPPIRDLHVAGAEICEIDNPSIEVPTMAAWPAEGGGDMVMRLVEAIRSRMLTNGAISKSRFQDGLETRDASVPPC